MLETVVGTNGILVPPDGYLAGVRELCDRHGIVLICDEVMAGFGRCGEWFAFHKWGVQPDLVCFAKGVNSGYLPLGGVVISQAIADTFEDRAVPGWPHLLAATRSACASAVASINIFKEEGIVEHARDARHRRHRPGAGRAAGQPPVDRRRPRARRVLGDRAGAQPRDPRAAGAVQRHRRRRQADERHRRGVQGQGRVAVHALQPACTSCRRATRASADVEHGLAVLDEALEIADALVTG